MRIIVSAALAFALAGCVSETASTSGGSGTAVVEAVPFDIAGMLSTYFAENPHARRFSLLNRRGEGFRFNRDGSVDHVAFGAISGLTTPTLVTEAQGNRFCLAPSGGWTGACTLLYGSSDGPVTATVTFGNGRQRTDTLTFSAD